MEVLKNQYWSKSEAFLLPLTGLARTQKYPLKSYLFWNDSSIEDYKLVIKFSWNDYKEFLDYCRRVIFPVLDRKGYIIESHDFGNETVMVLDLSEWALDIEMFLKGKYSKMSREARRAIKDYHTYYDGGYKIKIHILISLDPNDKQELLGKMTGIEYVAENYGLDINELRKVGELGGIYNKDAETLILKDEKVEHGEENHSS